MRCSATGQRGQISEATPDASGDGLCFPRTAFAHPEFFPQRLVLRFELSEASAHRRQRRVDFRLGEAWRDVLRAIGVVDLPPYLSARDRRAAIRLNEEQPRCRA